MFGQEDQVGKTGRGGGAGRKDRWEEEEAKVCGALGGGDGLFNDYFILVYTSVTRFFNGNFFLLSFWALFILSSVYGHS